MDSEKEIEKVDATPTPEPAQNRDGKAIIKKGEKYQAVALEDIPIDERQNYVMLMRFGEQPIYVPRYGKGGIYKVSDLAEVGSSNESISKRMSRFLRWYMSPKVETIEELDERIIVFFNECQELGDSPTYEKFCLALGVTTQKLKEWCRGLSTSEAWQNRVKLAVLLIYGVEGERAAEGEILANVYMFRAKNFYGMSDKVELSIAPTNKLGDTEDEDALIKRLLESTTVIDTAKNAEGVHVMKEELC